MTRLSNQTRRRRNAGYTVFEVLIVLGMIALLTAVVAPQLIGQLGKVKSQSAELQMDNLKGALKLFYIDTGRYPTEAEGLSALMTAPTDAKRWSGPYMESDTALTDPWERPYLYTVPQDGKPFEIKSLGRDGAVGGEGEDRDLSVS